MSGSATITLRNDLAELGRLSAAVEEFGDRVGLSTKVVFTLNLVLDELVTNVVSYGYGDDPGEHQLSVGLSVGDGKVTAVLEDDGLPFDPLSKSLPDLDSPLDQRGVGGLGVHFVRTMMDRVDYQRVGDHNRLTLVKTL